ncbi:hypothetical protein D6817_05425 [Candidatus Pacearchaeota archaeon]|nr:MAG: hypothetical protein D6817_05425 [Candidatus Pacearchaeota archaeon]
MVLKRVNSAGTSKVLLEENLREIGELFGKNGQELVSQLPVELIAEMVAYLERNVIAEVETGEGGKVRVCCPSCLKAHAISHARKKGFGEEVVEKLKGLSPMNAGHFGYYMDNGKLVKLDSE